MVFRIFPLSFTMACPDKVCGLSGQWDHNQAIQGDVRGIVADHRKELSDPLIAKAAGSRDRGDNVAGGDGENRRLE